MHHALLSANTLTLVVVDFPVALVEELVTVTARSLRYRREVEHFGSAQPLCGILMISQSL